MIFTVVIHVLIDDIRDPQISDFGLTGINNKGADKSIKIVSVIPYIAPEVLYGDPYTKAADIYIFGIIMTEFSTGKLSFSNEAHSNDLVLIIYCEKNLQEGHQNLIEKCVDSNPRNRPTATDAEQVVELWYVCSKKKNNYNDIKKS